MEEPFWKEEITNRAAGECL